MHTEAVAWTSDGMLALLDQTLLPGKVEFHRTETIDDLVESIQTLKVRGAPLLGVAGAMGLAACARQALQSNEFLDGVEAVRIWLTEAAGTIKGSRPTAVNLGWAVDRAMETALSVLGTTTNQAAGDEVVAALRDVAQEIWDDDADRCLAIGRQGVTVVPEKANILTICNTGMLATGGIGTAFGVIRTAFEAGRVNRVYACETRPLCQGARLTSWELSRLGVPSTVLVDSAAASLMKEGKANLVVTGADRIAANGDSANKIGTLALANLAHVYGIPFYIAAPLSTVDPKCLTGSEIPIEYRGAAEIADLPGGIDVYNPAFDVTPAERITGIITEAGVLLPPFEESIGRVVGG